MSEPKNKLIKFTLRGFRERARHARPTIKLAFLLFFMLISLGIGIVTFFQYPNNPLFVDAASNLHNYVAFRLIVSFAAAAITFLFGLFFTNALLMIPSKKIQIFNMGIEYDQDQIEHERTRNTTYLSQMLINHPDTLAHFISGDVKDYESVIEELIISYIDISKAAHPDRSFNWELKRYQNFDQAEKNLYEEWTRFRSRNT